MFRIILSLQLTVFLFTTLSVEEPQLIQEEFQLEEEPLPVEDVDFNRIKLTTERFGPPSNAQFVPIPVVPIPGHLKKPDKRPGKVSGPPPPPKRKPLRPSKRPKPVRSTTPIPSTSVSEVETIKPLPLKPITAAPFESITTPRPVTRPPVTHVHLLTTAESFIPIKRPIRVSTTTPEPDRPTRPVTTRPRVTKKPLRKPYRHPQTVTTTPRSNEPVPSVYSTHILEDDGSYFFQFLAENSVQRAERGFFKILNDEEFPIHVKIGNYSFTSPEGTKYKVEYIADENGYRVSPDT